MSSIALVSQAKSILDIRTMYQKINDKGPNLSTAIHMAVFELSSDKVIKFRLVDINTLLNLLISMIQITREFEKVATVKTKLHKVEVSETLFFATTLLPLFFLMGQVSRRISCRTLLAWLLLS